MQAGGLPQARKGLLRDEQVRLLKLAFSASLPKKRVERQGGWTGEDFVEFVLHEESPSVARLRKLAKVHAVKRKVSRGCYKDDIVKCIVDRILRSGR